ncbi:uncharacterized protein LOC126678876 [Mercurialis annua]|uniref:uncharacterized protein LOC126678876 n=1 Tax=Mercurialis annua TaxID=3986 RepID=UPI00215F5B3E|nr:uncharacterized protein LOC126678876 [Mercurialis annua]
MGTEGDSTFPAADVERELDAALNKDFEVDSVSSHIAASKDIKKNKNREKKDAMQTLKTTILVSAVIVAVAGAVIVFTKKLREK